jgi:hypothetical protein
MRPVSSLFLFTLLATTACGSSYAEPNRAPPWSATSFADAERPLSRMTPPWSDPGPVVESPYQVELLFGDSRRLPTYHTGGRVYVLGSIGERYRIRIANPTSRRVEAVVSVDGLDAIDGRTASYEDKRGYVIAPYGEVTIDGFRTSMDQVATFRFSSVRDSYAGRKGQDRNVGVIGVAFFPEREVPVHRLPPPYIADDRARGSSAPPAKPSPYDGPSASRSSGTGPAPTAEAKRDGAGAYRSSPGSAPAEQSRPGLGTEFGERRHSTVGYTSFQRESTLHPQNVVEIRYNDREGLLALGIPVDDSIRPHDVALRERANPFPQSRFASPPPR